MQAYVMDSAGLESLRLVDGPVPIPGPGEVRVRLRAASLNFRDVQVARGLYGPGGPSPLTPLSDGAGEIDAVGEGVDAGRIGERVAGIFMQGWQSGPVRNEYSGSALGGSIQGVLAQYRVFPESGVVRVPDYLSWEEAATLPCAAVTVWNALFVLGQARPGQILVALGTGGVSLFALQFAKAAGMRVILTSSSNAKLARGRELGADATINYRENPEWSRNVKEFTNGEGADHVVEIGGPGTLEQSLHALRTGGTVSMIGVLTGIKGEVSTALLLRKSIRMNGIYVGSRAMFEDMNRMLEVARIRPVVDRVFGFAEARAAYELMQSGGHFGKIVIAIE